MKNSLSLEEFYKLSLDERRIRYKELNSHDKFMVRVSDPESLQSGRVIGYESSSIAEQIQSKKKLLSLMVEYGAITQDKAEEKLRKFKSDLEK